MLQIFAVKRLTLVFHCRSNDQRVIPSQAIFLRQDMAGQAIEVIRDSIPMRSTLATAREYRLTAYDALYLEIALRQGLPLATPDRRLLAAATKAGVDVAS
jgi:predicted nucleic acid-binding protein